MNSLPHEHRFTLSSYPYSPSYPLLLKYSFTFIFFLCSFFFFFLLPLFPPPPPLPPLLPLFFFLLNSRPRGRPTLRPPTYFKKSQSRRRPEPTPHPRPPP